MTETKLVTGTPTAKSVGTIYIHLCSGEVREITNVEEIAVSDIYVVLTRGDDEAVVIDRSEIYYTCCQPGAAPSAY
jgi:hypothetical protein